LSIPIYGNSFTDSKDIGENTESLEHRLKEQFSKKPILERYRILSSHISTFLDQMEWFKDIMLLYYQVLIRNLAKDLRIHNVKFLEDILGDT